MVKDIIISAFRGYDYNVVKPYIDSINNTDFKGDKVLIAIDITDKTKQQIEDAGWICEVRSPMSNMMFHNERFYHLHQYMNKHQTQYRYMISTDVRDVIFQKDPTIWLKARLKSPHKIVAVSESILIQNEHWNRNNIQKCFPAEYERVANTPVLNVGILSGDADTLATLCGLIYQLSLNRADWVADQAAYNVLIRLHPYSNITMISTLIDAYACNLHITHKPNEKDMFKPYLLEKAPELSYGRMIEAETGAPYYIVHQYDRDPELVKSLIGNDK